MATFFGHLAKMTIHFLVKKPSLLRLSFFGLIGDLINSHSYVYYVINCMAVLIFLPTQDYWTVLISWGWLLYPCFCSPSLPFSTVNLWSLATGEQVHSIGFKSEVYDVLCNRRWVLHHLWKSKFCLCYTFFHKVVNMEQKAAAKQLSRHSSIDYSWMDQDITTLLLHSPWLVEWPRGRSCLIMHGQATLFCQDKVNVSEKWSCDWG